MEMESGARFLAFSIVYPCSVVCPPFSKISETAWPSEAKFYVETPLGRENQSSYSQHHLFFLFLLGFFGIRSDIEIESF